MAKVFLDANVFVDLIEERNLLNEKLLQQYEVFISPLSIHILAYLYKYKMPEGKLENIEETLTIIPFDETITENAFTGPTEDFEDNVQLHSAIKGECDFFLTNDRKLLNMHFFGKMRILSELTSKQE